jgi:hypothetical protein
MNMQLSDKERGRDQIRREGEMREKNSSIEQYHELVKLKLVKALPKRVSILVSTTSGERIIVF